MDMKIIDSEKRLCVCCMEEHEVKTVLIQATSTFKNVKVIYEAKYFYCDSLKDAYRKSQELNCLQI